MSEDGGLHRTPIVAIPQNSYIVKVYPLPVLRTYAYSVYRILIYYLKKGHSHFSHIHSFTISCVSHPLFHLLYFSHAALIFTVTLLLACCILYKPCLQVSPLCRAMCFRCLHLWTLRQVSQAGKSNCIPQYSVGCNYLCLPKIRASGAKVLKTLLFFHAGHYFLHLLLRLCSAIQQFVHVSAWVALLIHFFLSRGGNTATLFKVSMSNFFNYFWWTKIISSGNFQNTWLWNLENLKSIQISNQCDMLYRTWQHF